MLKYLTKTGRSLAGKHNCESTLLTDKELKAVNERVKRYVNDTGSMDEPTAKPRKYIAPTLQNSMHRLASTLRRIAPLGIFLTI